MKCSFRLCYLALVLMIPYIVSSFSVLHAPIANPLSASPSSSMFRATAAAPTRLHLTPDPVSRAAKVDTVGLSSSSLKKKNLRTFARYLEVECWKSPNLRSLESVLTSATRACAQISKIVQRAQTDDIYGAAVDKATGLALEANVQGEVQQKLDVVCNEIMKKAFCGCSDDVAAVATEEEEKPLMCSDVTRSQAINVGEYVAVFDPLDGSKNIASSLPVGTIFGIYRWKNLPPAGLGTFLQRGMNMVAAGYCLYSATTVLVLTMGTGVDGFTLDPDRNEFIQTHPDIRIPSCGEIVSFNEGNIREFEEPVQQFLQEVKTSGIRDSMNGDKRLKASCRYAGAMVADVHNVLVNGGIYGYPATRKQPNGKLRLMYESNPMAMIVEQAGGAASTGRGRILEVEPQDVHQRVPTFLGSTDNVFELEQFIKYYGK